MRQYEPGWIKLRTDPTKPLIISAHPAYHARIYKAIIKEKDRDLVYKLECEDAGIKTRLSKSSVGNALTITLTRDLPYDQLF